MTSVGMWSVMGMVGIGSCEEIMMMQQTPALTDSMVENEIKSDHVLVISKET